MTDDREPFREAMVRPNGKLYRPRKPPEVVTFHDYHECTGVAVLRTLDVQTAVELAADQIAEFDLDPANAGTDWWRSVPWDPTGYGDWAYLSDPVRGVPCVVIPYA